MKKSAIWFMAMVLCAAVGLTQDASSIKGKLNIAFNTRNQTGPKDVYTFDLNVTDSLIFAGKITWEPAVMGMGGLEKKSAELVHDVNLSVRNPANPAQTKAVGKFVGTVPIDKRNVYQYGNGTLRIAVDAAGKASEFSSTFRGTAAGVPPKGAAGGLLDRIKQQAVTVSKQVKGKTVSIAVTKYDKMTYNQVVMAMGPVKTYPESTVNGEMMYDYERGAWYFRNVTISYQVGGQSVTDKLTGNIKWVESAQRASNGEGHYEFDVRVNEPEVTQGTGEAAVFAKADDEASFFEADLTIPSLTGTANYKDTMMSDGTVTASVVDIALVGNQLNKQQVTNLAKLIWLVNVVPMNAE